jgi:DNA-binding CsgD family transcriptional regulator
MPPPVHKFIGELEEIVAAAAFDPAQWRLLAHRFRELVPEVKIFMHVTDKTTEQLQPGLAEGIGDDFLADYVAHYDSVNPWTKFTLDIPFMKPVASEGLIPSRTIRHTEFYQDFLRRLGESDAATFIKLMGDETRFAQFSVHYDSQRSDAIDPIVAPMLRVLGPAMRGSLEALRLRQTTVESDHYRSFLTALIHPAFVVDRLGSVKAANVAADRLLLQTDTIRIGALDRLSFDDPAVAKAVAAATARLPLTTKSTMTTISAAPALVTPIGHFKVSLLPLSANIAANWGVAEFWSATPTLLVSLSPIAPDAPQHLMDIRKALGLTRAEAALALHLAHGTSLADAAELQEVSYETARSQLKSIFAKLSISRQTELVAMLHRLLPGML